jgi:hypothetical protein
VPPIVADDGPTELTDPVIAVGAEAALATPAPTEPTMTPKSRAARPSHLSELLPNTVSSTAGTHNP